MKTARAAQQLFVDRPCSEKFEAMKSVADGKFCSRCQHVVHDFSEWPKQDVISFLSSQNSLVCGRFTNEQVSSPSGMSKWKLSVMAVLALWFSSTKLKAQSSPQVEPRTIAVSDSVVLIVKGEVKSGEKIVWGALIEARDSSGNLIATTRSNSGKFELHVPLANPKQTFSITASAKGYRKVSIENYVGKAGNVLGIQMTRKLFGRPARVVHTLGCPSF